MAKSSPKTSLKVSKTMESKDIILLTLKGSLETSTVGIWESAIHEVMNSGLHHIVVDFSGLSYLSSAGIGVFVGCIGALREKGGDIVFLNPSNELLNIFDMLGFNKLFKIVSDRKEAIDSFQLG